MLRKLKSSDDARPDMLRHMRRPPSLCLHRLHVLQSLRSDEVTKNHDCQQDSRLSHARIVKASHLERSKHEWSLPRASFQALRTAYKWLCAPAHCKTRSGCQPSPRASGPGEETQCIRNDT